LSFKQGQALNYTIESSSSVAAVSQLKAYKNNTYDYNSNVITNVYTISKLVNDVELSNNLDGFAKTAPSVSNNLLNSLLVSAYTNKPTLNQLSSTNPNFLTLNNSGSNLSNVYYSTITPYEANNLVSGNLDLNNKLNQVDSLFNNAKQDR